MQCGVRVGIERVAKAAKQLGANAIVDTGSYYKKIEMSSPTQFECHEGTFTVAVALRGDFVTIANK
jgi:uncharacterized protein YbjQ (UPF0145 family)